MKKLILVGKTQCGKTTLTQRILNEDIKYHKTQALDLVGKFIYDTPGEYLEKKFYRGALFVAAAEADLMVFMQSATDRDTTYFPPMYSALFPKPIIGLVTKCDIATPEQIEAAKVALYEAGVPDDRVYVISSVTGEGFDKLLAEIEVTEEDIKMMQEAEKIKLQEEMD